MTQNRISKDQGRTERILLNEKTKHNVWVEGKMMRSPEVSKPLIKQAACRKTAHSLARSSEFCATKPFPHTRVYLGVFPQRFPFNGFSQIPAPSVHFFLPNQHSTSTVRFDSKGGKSSSVQAQKGASMTTRGVHNPVNLDLYRFCQICAANKFMLTDDLYNLIWVQMFHEFVSIKNSCT